MFFTRRNVGMALSFTLALVVAEASLPPSVAVRVFLGAGGGLSGHLGRALVRSTDAGVRAVAGFCAVAFLLALLLPRAHQGMRWVAGQTSQGVPSRVAMPLLPPGPHPDGASGTPVGGRPLPRAG